MSDEATKGQPWRWNGSNIDADPVRRHARYLTDDRDLDERHELVIFKGENGDWYVGIAREGRAPLDAVRLCTSGGAASAAPGLTVAISDAWAAIISAEEKP